MYCPNCNAPVVVSAESCSECSADFGTGSAWRPVPFHKTPKRRFVVSGTPTISHATLSVALFAVLGPLFGLFAGLVFNSPPRGSLLFAFHPFAITGAFVIGFIPALLAGLVYCIVSLTIISVFPRATIRSWSGALLGAFAGWVAAVISSWSLFAGTPAFSVENSELLALCIPAGFMAGLVAGWLHPIGRLRASKGIASA